MKKELTEEQKEKARERAKLWYENNKEKAKQTRKEYTEKTKDERKIRDKNYRENNSDKIEKWKKDYKQNNIDKIKIFNQINIEKYRKNNPDKIKIQTKKYRENNIAKIKQSLNKWRAKNKNYNKKRKLIDPLFKLKLTIRCMIYKSLYYKLYRKTLKSCDILGCSFEEFKLHIELKFESWMNWENHGNPKDGLYELNKTWDIDHIVPLASAKTEDEIISLNHYTNLQPLCSYTNRFIKKDDTRNF